jgi:hypothetical protein
MSRNMEKLVSKDVQKSCKESQVVTIEAQSMLRTIAGPREWSDTRQSWLAKAARRLGWPYARTSNIFYGRARLIRAEEWIRLNEELSTLNKSAQQRGETIHDISILARTTVAPAGEAIRPMGVESHATREAGPWGKRSA